MVAGTKVFLMKKIILLNKKEGETPLEALEVFRSRNKEYKNEKITYAGRLDPMASGLLVLLVGDKVHEKEKYLHLSKEYEFEVLFGVATDTYDILGKIADIRHGVYLEISTLNEILKDFKGPIKQKYPAYSSKTVKGRPLFAYARAGEGVEVPEREILVKEFKFLEMRKIPNEKLLENVEKRIKKVKGDFRQEEILETWRKNLMGKKNQLFVGSFKIKCGSGTYVRGIANSLGEKIGVPALAYSIKRTKVGRFSLKK